MFIVKTHSLTLGWSRLVALYAEPVHTGSHQSLNGWMAGRGETELVNPQKESNTRHQHQRSTHSTRLSTAHTKNRAPFISGWHPGPTATTRTQTGHTHAMAAACSSSDGRGNVPANSSAAVAGCRNNTDGSRPGCCLPTPHEQSSSNRQ